MDLNSAWGVARVFVELPKPVPCGFLFVLAANLHESVKDRIMNPTVPITQLSSSEIAHDVFAVAAMSIPVLLLLHDQVFLAILIGGFEYALFYSLGGPRITI